MFHCRIYGPNSEIEWNKEGSRGFLLLNRKPSQTALSDVTDKAVDLGKHLNKKLQDPCVTTRDRLLKMDNDVRNSEKIVTGDPSSVNIKTINMFLSTVVFSLQYWLSFLLIKFIKYVISPDCILIKLEKKDKNYRFFPGYKFVYLL